MVRLLPLFALLACTPTTDGVLEDTPVEGLYDTAATEDGSCRLLDGAGDMFACSELHEFACAVGEGTGVTAEASAERCPDGATATCGDDSETLWSYYGAADGALIGAWCEACATDPVPADVCDSAAVDSDGDGALSDADCDDADASVFPGAAETCDGIDEDCSGAVDDGIVVENGACVEGAVACDSGYSTSDDVCVAWRDAWIGDYTYVSECDGYASSGIASLAAEGGAPTDLVAWVDESDTFGIVLSGAEIGSAPDLSATVARDPGTGVIVFFLSGTCGATFTP
ncbi:MAG: putative metal-binding motif-containing protein [Pseudomonadota bacterium]|nr:putative metal-binding motif-containing protein [Pseudomonadota bacterium]